MPEPLGNNLSLQGEAEKKGGKRYVDNPITVVLTKVKPDCKKEGMNIGYFDGGQVFDIPVNVNVTKVRAKVTSEKNGKKFCQFIEPAYPV